MEKQPNLFLVGAPKCATTTLYEYLSRHEQICMSKSKEPAFFDKDYKFFENYQAKENEWYLYLKEYAHCLNSCKWFGDATPILVFSEVAKRIRKMTKDPVKIIACLRDPVDRAYSHYWHAYRLGIEERSFGETLEIEDPYVIRDTGSFPKYYVLNGEYHKHLRRYVELFGRKNLMLIKFEDFVNRPQLILNEIWKFLGVEELYINESYKENTAMLPRYLSIQKFLVSRSKVKDVFKYFLPLNTRKRIISYLMRANLKHKKYPPLNEKELLFLSNYYHDHNVILRNEYDFDISGWHAKEGQFF